jgi:hypothetical protein
MILGGGADDHGTGAAKQVLPLIWVQSPEFEGNIPEPGTGSAWKAWQGLPEGISGLVTSTAHEKL